MYLDFIGQVWYLDFELRNNIVPNGTWFQFHFCDSFKCISSERAEGPFQGPLIIKPKPAQSGIEWSNMTLEVTDENLRVDIEHHGEPVTTDLRVNYRIMNPTFGGNGGWLLFRNPNPNVQYEWDNEMTSAFLFYIQVSL